MIQPNEQSTMKQVGTIVKVAGPLIVATGLADVQMFDVVRVSEKRLIGEVIELRGDRASGLSDRRREGVWRGHVLLSPG